MSIHPKVEFDRHGQCRLGEDNGRPGDSWEGLELQRHSAYSLAQEGRPVPPPFSFDLTILADDDDMTFHGMTADELDRLGDHLKRLARAP